MRKKVIQLKWNRECVNGNGAYLKVSIPIKPLATNLKGKESSMTTLIPNKLYPIKGFPDYYITKTGDVYSKKYNRDFRKLKPKPQYRGYLLIHLWLNRKQYTKSIHRLVAETFIPNPDNKPQVNHKNGIKTDNRVENLEFCTQSENILHSYQTLHRKENRQYTRWNKGGQQ